jgi:tetratricopeptide (TPR) repeat protein
VEEVLGSLDVDGSTFESWPSSPNHPLQECLLQIDEADAVVLLLGDRYGSVTPDGVSATRAEYRHAVRVKKPLFSFLLKRDSREAPQEDFVQEVRGTHWHGPEIESLDELKEMVRRGLLLEFTRCFRAIHAMPPHSLPAPPQGTARSTIVLPADRTSVVRMLGELYVHGRETDILALKQACLSRFGDDPDVRNFIYMVEVNCGINGMNFDSNLVTDAVHFWASGDAKKRWAPFSLLYNQGNALMALKRYGEAVEKYDQALRLEPRFAECWKNIGSAQLSLGNRSLAKGHYETAIKYQPKLFEALYCLGAALAEDNEDADRALGYMERIGETSLAPGQQAAVCTWRAILYLRLGRYSEGISNGEQAIQADPDQAWAWQHTARLYAVARRQDKKWLRPASDFWRRFVKRFPQSGQGWSELGFTLWFLRAQAGEVESQVLTKEALDAFESAVSHGPADDGLVWDRIGHLREDLDDMPEAERAFREAVARDRPQFLFCLAECLISQQQFTDALPLATESAEKYQCDAHGWNQVGRCYSALRMFAEAIAAYEKAIKLDPGYPNAWFELGGLYWNWGLSADALAIWKDAVSRFPGHDLARRVKDFLAHPKKP